jgi:hypothetical protein
VDLGFAIPFGVLAGLAATVPMFVVEAVARRIRDPAVVLDWIQNEATMEPIWRRNPQLRVRMGLILHFLHGAGAGLVFVLAIVLVQTTVPVLVLGFAYGLILWMLSLSSYRRIVGRSPFVPPAGGSAVGLSLVAHLVFGLSLAGLAGLL